MDYVTRYYKNLSEKLTERLQLLESILPGVRPSGSRLFPTTRLLTPEEREEDTPSYDLLDKTPDLGLLGRQDWYTKAKESYWRSPQGQQRSAQMTSGFRAPAKAIGEVGQQMAALSDKYAQPVLTPERTTPIPPTTETPSWLSGLKTDVNKAVAAKPAEPKADYRQVARDAQKAVEEKRIKSEQGAQRFAAKPTPAPIPSPEYKRAAQSDTYETEEDKRAQTIKDIERERRLARQQQETPFKERVRQPKLLGSLDTPYDIQRRERMAGEEMRRERETNRQKAEETARRREEYRAWKIQQQMEQ